MKRYYFYCSFILFFFTALNLKSQWQFMGFAPFASNPYFISVPDCNTIAIAGGTLQMPRVYLSTSGGGNFINITGNITGGELYSVWAKNKDTIFVGDGGGPGGVGGNAKVWRTFNRGANWTVILTTGGSAGFINGIVFERPVQKFGAIFSDPPSGSACWYSKTYDGGVTWSVITGPPSMQVTGSIFCVDSLLFGFGMTTPPPRIYYTSNGGTSWYVVPIPGVSGIVSSIAFSNDKLNGIAGTSSMTTTIGRTTNGGASWFAQSIGSGLTGYCNMKWIWGTQISFLSGAVGPGGCIKVSYNNGANWNQMTTAGITGVDAIDANREVNGTNGWAVASDGTLIRLACGVIKLDNYSNRVPQTFKLEQNYPNPFNPVTKIRFEIPRLKGADGSESRGSVLIKVYDLPGNEVTTLVNEELSPGVYEVEFNASNMSSGIYYYRLIAGDFVDSKKMVLIK